MSYLDALKKLKRPPVATDETDKSPLSSVSSVPDRPLSKNTRLLSRQEQEELRVLVAGSVRPDELVELLEAAMAAGAEGLAVYREITAVNAYLAQHEHG